MYCALPFFRYSVFVAIPFAVFFLFLLNALCCREALARKQRPRSDLFPRCIVAMCRYTLRNSCCVHMRCLLASGLHDNFCARATIGITRVQTSTWLPLALLPHVNTLNATEGVGKTAAVESGTRGRRGL